MNKNIIEDLNLSVSTYNVLKRSGVNFVDQLCEMTENDIHKLRNMHKRNLRDINEQLTKIGLSLKSV